MCLFCDRHVTGHAPYEVGTWRDADGGTACDGVEGYTLVHVPARADPTISRMDETRDYIRTVQRLAPYQR